MRRMNPVPTGRVVPTESGAMLILTRTFRADIQDVWRSVTDSEHTAKWFGRWTGEPGPGKFVELFMGFEKETTPAKVLIQACEAPRHLAVSMHDAFGEWRLELFLEQTGEDTTLTFIHHLSDVAIVSDTGPGWEYYLDMLVAARAGSALPAFGDYYPAQKDYFVAQIPKK